MKEAEQVEVRQWAGGPSPSSRLAVLILIMVLLPVKLLDSEK
jgi:hypothetical protein